MALLLLQILKIRMETILKALNRWKFHLFFKGNQNKFLNVLKKCCNNNNLEKFHHFSFRNEMMIQEDYLKYKYQKGSSR